MAITSFKVIQGYHFKHQSEAQKLYATFCV